ncbi:hypothetical protein A3C91_00815 [Candidatus Azambacteria bacterium RIFCSPHIGHO2_02_FULL_52_12]|uniref:Nmd3 N-terminal domain-containing protein n=1 Tax=Candidatus Azambacteria bacterium RIFCSPLOWO2_01_FULL_46_25 TaxID=1797298 RepID=A0A1F5BTZ5_9BACT|nr:MAG: hypothetical protein A3C91_00815 [Candidatus Azambacteria bacterium RIFCSPHIGHO2_02_FULL_52_12]OGD34065.1 MAG: hypothetical protein A2988_01095 [Candidatus Azambacteria bacterium RIFCSPLOWO2_01_FULL_46_25]OGD37816.1 MAG: hypothetical protein A2850_04435 [Candidatus Azambacteria bacterium RIFCSPHIGHO2_01_FULL_51_74]
MNGKRKSQHTRQVRREDWRDKYRKTPKGLVICPRCRNVLFKKAWHHPQGQKVLKKEFAGKDVHFLMCPACTMTTQHMYEGEIRLHDVPARHEAELMHLIAGYGARAERQDSQHRVIGIEKQKGGYSVTTTEDQLAVRLAKKIKDVFKKTELAISYSKEPFKVSRMEMYFHD